MKISSTYWVPYGRQFLCTKHLFQLTSRMSSSAGFLISLVSCRSPHLPLQGVGGSVSLNTLVPLSSLCHGLTAVSRKAMAFGWEWAFKISALLSASSRTLRPDVSHRGGGGGGYFSASLCSEVTSQSKRKRNVDGLTDIKCIVLCKWLVHGNISLPDINPGTHTRIILGHNVVVYATSLMDQQLRIPLATQGTQAGSPVRTESLMRWEQLSLHAAKIPSAAN